MTEHNPTFIILSPGFAASEDDSNCLPMQQHFIKTINQIRPGLNVVILALQYPYHHGVYNWFDNVVFSFNGRNRGGLQKLLLRKKSLRVLKELNGRSPITGLLSFWYGECAQVGQAFSNLSGVPHYCWILGQDARKENTYPGHVKLKSGQLIALSDFLQNEFQRNHSLRPDLVIPPGIDIGGFSNKDKTIDVAGIGSFIPLKKFDTWLEVIRELKKDRPGIKAILAGDGPEKDRLHEMVKQMELCDNVELPGELPHPEILSLLKTTKLLVHPSGYEGFSGVCQEALACGAHVVSFTRAMQGEIGQWHVVNDKVEMIHEANRILNDPGVKFEPNYQFSMKETAEKILNLYPGFS